MVLLFRVIFLITFLTLSRAPPVDKKPKEQPKNDDWMSLEYQKYLKEVVDVLEEDPDFKARLEKADPEHIKSGDIAEHLGTLPKGVRDKLTEIKRFEIERLREAIRKQVDSVGPDQIQIPEHLDTQNLNTFEKEDLKKLIQKATKDLEDLDTERRKDFKEYEMKKEADRRRKLAHMTPEEREKAEKEFEERKKAHKEHPAVKHPGSKAQLEEVWEDVDQLPKEDFDPKTFFGLHDLNGDGFWDMGEVEALFQRELDKVYNDTDPNDDPRERVEEMNKMREHMVKEIDKNSDQLISFDEFMGETKDADFEKDEGWKGLEDEEFFDEEELSNYEKEMARENGWDDMPEGGYPAHYPPPQPPGHPQQPHPGGVPQQPPQVPPQHGQPPPPPQQHQQYPPQQGHPVPQHHEGGVPLQQVQGQPQPPQGHQQPPQGVPPAQAQGGVPPAQPHGGDQAPPAHGQPGAPPVPPQAGQPVGGQPPPQHQQPPQGQAVPVGTH